LEVEDTGGQHARLVVLAINQSNFSQTRVPIEGFKQFEVHGAFIEVEIENLLLWKRPENNSARRLC